MKRLVAMVGTVALLSACARARVPVHEHDVRPATYEPRGGSTLARTTGRLRRVALVVVPFDASPDDPRWCLDPCDIKAEERSVAERVLELLRDWRGYEVVTVDTRPAPDAQSLAAFARGLDVDGVFVLRGDAVYLTWADGVFWFATFTFAVPLSMARAGTRVELDLYETTRGGLVWRSVASGDGSLAAAANLADAVVEPLEPAWPLALTAPDAADGER